MKRKYYYILIDSNNLFFKNYFAAKRDLETNKSLDIYNLTISYCIKDIQIILDRFSFLETTIYFLFDNSQSTINIRKTIDESYKSNRDITRLPLSAYRILSLFKEILKVYSYNFKIVLVPSLEADDLTKPIIEKLNLKQSHICLCISGDLDWSRNISEFVHWFNWDKIFTIEIFFNKYGFNPTEKKIILYKVIRGDISDSIPIGIPNLPENILLYILDNFRNVQELLSNVDKIESKHWKYKILEKAEILKNNEKLLSFIDIESDIEDFIIHCQKNDKQKKLWLKSVNIEDNPIKEGNLFGN